MGESMGGLFSVNYAGYERLGRELAGIMLLAPGLLLHHAQMLPPRYAAHRPARASCSRGKPVGDDAAGATRSAAGTRPIWPSAQTDTLALQAITPAVYGRR